MRVIFTIIILVYLSIQFIGCELMDEAEPIPTYATIDTIKLETQQNSEGTNSHKIRDAWLFVDGQLLGAYELPMLAPVLDEGEHTVEIFAGMADNGIVSYPEIYPFYNRYITTKKFIPGETIAIDPSVKYDSKTIFSFIEDFEDGNIFGGELDGDIGTKIELIRQGRFEGNRSGKITLTAVSPIFEAATLLEYPIFDEDNVSSPIYLEINYKNNVPFEVGIMGFKGNAFIEKTYVAGFNPKDVWNKVYVNLTLDTSVMDGDSYKIVIRAAKGEDVETGEIYLDNINEINT